MYVNMLEAVFESCVVIVRIQHGDRPIEEIL